MVVYHPVTEEYKKTGLFVKICANLLILLKNLKFGYYNNDAGSSIIKSEILNFKNTEVTYLTI